MSTACVALMLFTCGQTLRLAAMRRLDERWSVRVITVPSEPVIQGGIFSRLRHPNYLGVALELFALPLVHGAWTTALVASALNAVLLSARIRVEETALTMDQDYARALGLAGSASVGSVVQGCQVEQHRQEEQRDGAEL